MRVRDWIAAAVVPLTVAACAVPGIGRTTGQTPPAPAPASAPAPGEKPAEGRPKGSAPQRSEAEPLATATFKPGAELSAEVSVLALKRRGKLLDLVLSITARSKSDTYVSVEEFTGAGPSAITLVDAVRLKRYLIVRDSAGRPLRPPYWIIKVGEASVRTYTFPAPGPEVTELDVSIGAEPPFLNVPVT
ncbi:hypothetical protein SAMN05444920_114122 [Nonomuraea solani]|uniref:Uncharacterized protein n=1 Tax=Nonomuraea solani TaxID=1144553 RepID=A0A1H6ES63_9ACTN|nr:hypothetical protein [Nonomuraea solani]SEG99846.1 hypothetical protein SAMN05444920_114122 [Nonomuraea solani]